MKILSRAPFYVTAELLRRWFARHNPYKAPPADFYINFGRMYGVNAEMAFIQMCHETKFLKYGGDVKPEQNNFAGIGATGGGVPGESYDTISKGVEAHIQNLTLYAGKRLNLSDVISERARRHYDIYLGRSPTWEGLQDTWSMDEEYWKKLASFHANFRSFVDSVTDYDLECGGLDLYNDGSVLVKVREPGVLSYERKIEPIEPEAPEDSDSSAPPRLKLKLLLSVGHSERVAGASGKNKAVKEYDLNRYQVTCLHTALKGYGIFADITDRPDDDLTQTGAAAKGYDAFIEMHLNALRGIEYYTTAMVHKSFESGDSPSSRLAHKLAVAASDAIKNPLFSGSAGYPSGVMAAGLSVLRAAANAGCPVRVLTENEFIDDETSDAPIKKRIEAATKAQARAIYEFFK